jgi:hypothetical protein
MHPFNSKKISQTKIGLQHKIISFREVHIQKVQNKNCDKRAGKNGMPRDGTTLHSNDAQYRN